MRPPSGSTSSFARTCAISGSRTTCSRGRRPANHYRVTQDLFRTLYEKGYIVERETLGAFSASTGHTLPDRYIEGTCPICGFESARGDQCDNCGNQLDPTDLIDPRSRIDGDDAGVPRDEAPLPRPARVQGAADGVDRVAGATGGRTSSGSR